MLLFLLACSASPADSAPDTAEGETDAETDTVPDLDTDLDFSLEVSLAFGHLEPVADAAPSPDGSLVYFTQENSVQVGPLDGSAAPETFAEVSGPVALAVSLDGTTLYVSAADGLHAYDTTSREASVIDVGGHLPTGMHYITFDGVEWLYFSADTGLYRYTPAEMRVETMLQGAPLVHPTGVLFVTLASVFLYDAAAGTDGRATLLRADSGGIWTVTEGFVAGSPAGVAAPLASTLVMMSALDESGHSELVVYDRASNIGTTFAEGISENVGSGGLHRAAEADVFAWTARAADGTGSVYRFAY